MRRNMPRGHPGPWGRNATPSSPDKWLVTSPESLTSYPLVPRDGNKFSRAEGTKETEFVMQRRSALSPVPWEERTGKKRLITLLISINYYWQLFRGTDEPLFSDTREFVACAEGTNHPLTSAGYCLPPTFSYCGNRDAAEILITPSTTLLFQLHFYPFNG